MIKPAIETPCVNVCTLMPNADGPRDPMADGCVGCGRTRAEIAQWIQFSPEERAAIMDVLPQRREALRAAILQRTQAKTADDERP